MYSDILNTILPPNGSVNINSRQQSYLFTISSATVDDRYGIVASLRNIEWLSVVKLLV